LSINNGEKPERIHLLPFYGALLPRLYSSAN